FKFLEKTSAQDPLGGTRLAKTASAHLIAVATVAGGSGQAKHWSNRLHCATAEAVPAGRSLLSFSFFSNIPASARGLRPIGAIEIEEIAWRSCWRHRMLQSMPA